MGTAEISAGRGLRGLLGTRWAALAPRDRLALQVLLAFAVLLAFWFGAWMPTRHALQQARRDVAAEQQLQRHLRANAVRAGAAAQRGAALKASELPAMLSALADEQGLTIHQVQPRPEQRFAVSLEGAPAQALLWLQALQDRGLGVAELRLLQQPDGSWQGEAVLQGPAS